MGQTIVLRNQMRTTKIEYRGILAILLVVNYILIQFLDNQLMRNFASVYTCFYILLSLPALRGMVARITYVLLLSTVALLVGQSDFLHVLMEGAITNLSIVCILVLTPLLGIPVRTGDYIESLQRMLAKLGNRTGISYVMFLLLTHLLSVVLNIGSIVINLHLISSSTLQSKRLIASILVRGYTTITTWSPYMAIMILVIGQLGIPWSSLAIYTIGFALTSLIVAVVMESKALRREKSLIRENGLLMKEKDVPQKKTAWKIVELVVVLFLSTGLVLWVMQATDIGMVMSISAVSVLFPFVWCLLKGQSRGYVEEVRRHTTSAIPNLQGEFTLFLVAGIFSYVFVRSPLSDQFVNLLHLAFGSSTLLLGIVLSVTMIGAAVAGLHPVVLLTVFVTTIDPAVIGFSPIQFAFLLLGSTAVANTISPSTAVNNLLSKELRVDLFTISFRWNWRYATVLFCILHLFLQVTGV
ncbi:hypothetical protein AB1K83_08420 [Sporosarcina sp. 179-K 3D1 HS]|uniref:hypothetical protein n=1 Tax=Sporosarcina sp. 179-K 3D1 HS TaxID=3232169 RepID=UPI00399F632A